MAEKKSKKKQTKENISIQELDDLDFMRSTSAAILEQTPKRSRLLLYSIIIFLIIIVLWAGFAELDEVTRGSGKVIPSQQIQVVQNLEGGILSELLVKEGQLVEKGQVLIQIDDNSFESSFMESRLRYWELLAKSARLEAEAEGKNSFVVPQEVLEMNPELAKNEQSLFNSRLRELKNSVRVIESQTQSHRHQISEAKAKAKQIKRSLRLAKKELNIIKPLYKSGAVSQVNLIKVERQVYELEANLDEVNLTLPRLNETIKESQGNKNNIINAFRSKAREELNSAQAEIPRILESIESLEDKLTRTSVRSPVKGTVKQILVNTIGGVIKPGMDLVEIVPFDDALLVEAKIKPSDIGYLFPGQKAVVKFSAYDSSLYGGLDAELVHISADTIVEMSGGKEESYYVVRVKTDKNFLGDERSPLPIIPGMTTNIDILTGKKTVLNYLFKPIIKAKNTALRER